MFDDLRGTTHCCINETISEIAIPIETKIVKCETCKKDEIEIKTLKMKTLKQCRICKRIIII